MRLIKCAIHLCGASIIDSFAPAFVVIGFCLLSLILSECGVKACHIILRHIFFLVVCGTELNRAFLTNSDLKVIFLSVLRQCGLKVWCILVKDFVVRLFR